MLVRIGGPMKKIIAICLIILMVSSTIGGCVWSNNEEYDEKVKSQSFADEDDSSENKKVDIEEEALDQPSNIQDEIGETEVDSDNNEDEANGDIEPIGAEEDFIYYLAGGLFYTSVDNQEYLHARNAGVLRLNDYADSLFLKCQELYTNGILDYEEIILAFTDKFVTDRERYEDELAFALSSVVDYNIAIESLFGEINEYRSKIESDSLDASNAYLMNASFSATLRLYSLLEEYIDFLGLTSEVYASGIADGFNDLYADAIRQNTKKLFDERLAPIMADAIVWYEMVGLAYTQLENADYYYARGLETDLVNRLESLEESSEIDSIIMNLKAYNETPPAILIAKETEDSISSWLPFIIQAHADEGVTSNDLQMAVDIAKMEPEILKDGEAEIWSKSNGVRSEEVLGRLISRNDQIILDRISTVVSLVNGYLESEHEEEPADEPTEPAETMLQTTVLSMVMERILSEADIAPVCGFGGIEGTWVPIPLENKTMFPNYSNQTNNYLIRQNELEQVYQKIRNIGVMKEGINPLNLMEDISNERAYTMIVSSLVTMVEHHKTLDNTQVLDQIIRVLEEDLGEILGDNREAFVDRMFQKSLNENVLEFVKWINESENSKDIEFMKDGLVERMSEMGFDYAQGYDLNNTIEEAEEYMESEYQEIENKYSYFADGTISKMTTHYDSGKAKSTFNYHQDGELVSEVHYWENGKKQHQIIYYHDTIHTQYNGQVSEESFFSIDGSYISKTKYDKEGNIISN